MAVTFESAARLTALKNKIDGVTGAGSSTLSEAVDNALAGYGQGGGNDVLYALIARTITELRDENITEIGKSAFYDLASLKTVHLPNVTRMSANAFRNCTGLEAIELPALTTAEGNGEFYGCTSLTSISLPNLENVFPTAAYCSSLTSVYAPKVQSLGTNIFAQSSALEKLSFPSATVVYQSFANMAALKTVDLSAQCSFIRANTFQNSPNVIALMLRSNTLCTINNVNVLNNSTFADGTAYIYVPSALVDEYKTATNWSVFAEQFRALEDYTADGTTAGELDETKISGGTE